MTLYQVVSKDPEGHGAHVWAATPKIAAQRYCEIHETDEQTADGDSLTVEVTDPNTHTTTAYNVHCSTYTEIEWQAELEQ